MKQSVHLGFEVGSGRAVEIPLRHLAITGQTQEAGKTTTLEALVSRSGVPTIAFVTKRFEQSFRRGREIPPYFRERADWQFVASILEAALRERMKFQRSWIMKLCEASRQWPAPRTLADVQRNVEIALKTARGIHEGVYTELRSYLQLVVPQIDMIPFSRDVSLGAGLNIMKLDDYSLEMQSLIIQSVLDWVYKKADGTVVVIPEAWEFIPRKRGSPVKLAAEQLIRKGAGGHNYVWLDSQDIASIDGDIRKSIIVWLLGVQREANEVKRTLAHIPLGSPKPSVKDIMTLEKGQFFVCHGQILTKVYVQPAWMTTEDAKSVSFGSISILEAGKKESKEEPTVKESEAKALREENDRLKEQVRRLTRNLESKKAVDVPWEDGRPTTVEKTDLEEEEGLYQRFKTRLAAEAPVLLRVMAERPELQVEVERLVIKADGGSLRGWLARLVADDFFKSAVSGGAAQKELARRGYNANISNLYKELGQFALMGFLIIEDGKDDQSRARKEYRAVPGMKVQIIEK